MQTHLAGKAHKRRLANSQTLQSFHTNDGKTFSPESKSENDDKEDGEKVDEATKKSSSVTFAGPALQCDLCKVSVNSIQQLNVHYTGARHKKLAAKNGKTANSSSSTFLQSLTSCAVELPNSIIRVEDLSKKLAGSYKCKACDCLLNSEVQMQQVRRTMIKATRKKIDLFLRRVP